MTTDAASGSEEWEGLARWWIEEGSRDPVYAETVHPWLADLLAGAGEPLLDLGCGEGQTLRAVARRGVIGVDASLELLRSAAGTAPVVRGRLPHLDWLRSDSVAGAYSLFVLEHLPELTTLFDEVARVVVRDGVLVVVGNHPAYTAPGSGPIVDERDGEVLWRWGPYFSASVVSERIGAATVTFHHRTLGMILGAAAGAGWCLERFEERGLDPAQVARTPSLAGQEQMPRMYAARWRLG